MFYALSFATLGYTFIMIYVMTRNTILKQRLLQPGHICILCFSLLDLAHAAMHEATSMLMDNVVMCLIASAALPLHWMKSSPHRQNIKMAHLVFVLAWLPVYGAVTPFTDPLAIVNAVILGVGLVLILLGWLRVYSNTNTKFFE